MNGNLSRVQKSCWNGAGPNPLITHPCKANQIHSALFTRRPSVPLGPLHPPSLEGTREGDGTPHLSGGGGNIIALRKQECEEKRLSGHLFIPLTNYVKREKSQRLV